MMGEPADSPFRIFERGFIGDIPFAVCHQDGRLRVAIGTPWGEGKNVNVDIESHPQWDQLLTFASILLQAYKDIRKQSEPVT